MSRAQFLAACLTLLCLTTTNPAATGGAREDPVAHRVLAFYYPWYGTVTGPGGQGSVRHWGTIDAAAGDIAASTHYPVLGAYDSHDPALIEQHCRWAAEAGLDGFIVSWWGQGSYEDRALPLILDACGRFGLKACVYYERVPEPVSPNAAVADLIRLLAKAGRHPAYLRAHGKPVVFVYIRALNDLGLLGWHEVGTRLADYPGGVTLIGDHTGYAGATVFDGIHTYNTAGRLRGLDAAQVTHWAEQTYPEWVRLAREQNRISTLTVIPGYDDTKIRTPGLAVDRLAGALYDRQWEAALATDPDWILITSFNEWHEGSEIEPSREYDRTTLDATGVYADRFHDPRREPNRPDPAVTVNASEETALRRRLASLSVAALPNPQSPAFWWLLSRKPDLRVLSWEEVAAGALLSEPVDWLLYAGGESYRPTVHETGDVDRALQRYLDQGGTLVVWPSQPMPFYYDEVSGQAVRRAGRFGLSLKVAWKTPPTAGLRFVQPRPLLRHSPTVLAFPETGDRRWRPFTPTAQTLGYRSLLQLRDPAGRHLGDGLVWVDTGTGGRVVYGWFGLLRGPQTAALLYDLFDLLAP